MARKNQWVPLQNPDSSWILNKQNLLPQPHAGGLLGSMFESRWEPVPAHPGVPGKLPNNCFVWKINKTDLTKSTHTLFLRLFFSLTFGCCFSLSTPTTRSGLFHSCFLCPTITNALCLHTSTWLNTLHTSQLTRLDLLLSFLVPVRQWLHLEHSY